MMYFVRWPNWASAGNVALIACLVWQIPCGAAFAQPGASDAAATAARMRIEQLEERLRKLEARETRIDALQKELEDKFEKKLREEIAESAKVPAGWIPTIEKTAETKGELRKLTASEPTPAPAGKTGPAQAEPTKADPIDDVKAASKPGTSPALAQPEDLDALRDLQVIRDQAVTVKKGGFDLGVRFEYSRVDSPLQFSRSFTETTSLRYGLLPGMEVSLNVPLYKAFRSTQITPTEWFRTDIEAVGDISGQITGTIFRESLYLPGVFAYVGVAAPTGPDPYWIEPGQKPFAQPINPLYYSQSTGHWSGTVGVTAVKTLEPIIVFAGLSYTHFLPATYGGSTIQPGDRYSYRAGFGLAVSERTMIGASVMGTIAYDLVMDGLERFGASAESVLLNLSLTQRIAMGFYFEPAITLGLTQDAPAVIVGVGARKSF